RFIGIQKHGYGPLLDDPDRLLLLPRGFTYKIISRKGDKMADGFLVPGLADGMAAFEENGKVILVRNHEVSPGDIEQGPYGPNAERSEERRVGKECRTERCADE